MPDNEMFISENMFSPVPCSDFEQKNIGDAYDGWWGHDTYNITSKDLEALKNGKVLYSTINDEYAILIKLAKEVNDNE